MLKWIVTETVSTELLTLQEKFEAEMPKVLQELADVMTGENEDPLAPIPKSIGHMNPYLYTSGQLEKNRLVQTGLEFSEITISYSGLGLGRGDLIWWEFAKDTDWKPQGERELDRDYAFYQETGKDKIADSKKAKNIGGFRSGTESSAPLVREELVKQLKRLIK